MRLKQIQRTEIHLTIGAPPGSEQQTTRKVYRSGAKPGVAGNPDNEIR